MGCTKQLVSWPTAEGPQPLLAVAFDAVAAVCDCMLVVLDTDAGEISQTLQPRQFDPVVGDAAEMFHSVRAGLLAARERDGAAQILLQLGDHPRVAPRTLAALIQCGAEHPGKAILPEFGGRGGHPILIPPNLVDSILQFSAKGGLRGYWREHPDLLMRLPVDDPTVREDIDTPDQLSAAFSDPQ